MKKSFVILVHFSGNPVETNVYRALMQTRAFIILNMLWKISLQWHQSTDWLKSVAGSSSSWNSSSKSSSKSLFSSSVFSSFSTILSGSCLVNFYSFIPFHFLLCWNISIIRCAKSKEREYNIWLGARKFEAREIGGAKFYGGEN